ncbi:hypothetical protein MRB53_039744 [Persea americana]|nr:hypothetical protein MRB53_039744 [Persea americana]
MLKHQLRKDDDHPEEAEEDIALKHRQEAAESLNEDANNNGAGSLESRLQPTIRLPDNSKRPGTPSHKHKRAGSASHNGDSHVSRLRHHLPNSLMVGERKVNGKPSNESLSIEYRGRDRAQSPAPSSNGDGKKKRFTLHRHARSGSADSRMTKKGDKDKSDDLTQMMDRASNYMTLAYVKLTSVVLCLSYKGKGHRNIEDVHQLVFRMPTLEYRNKTWSNMDLVQAVKKDVIRALISHTGAIITNKFGSHKPGKAQQNRLRELANSSVILSNHPETPTYSSTNSSVADLRSLNSSSRPSDVGTLEQVQSSREEIYANASTNGAKHAAEDATKEVREPCCSTLAVLMNLQHASRETTPLRQQISRHISEIAGKTRRSNSTAAALEEQDDKSLDVMRHGSMLDNLKPSTTNVTRRLLFTTAQTNARRLSRFSPISSLAQ